MSHLKPEDLGFRVKPPKKSRKNFEKRHAYYSVILRYESDPKLRTRWHPTTSTGPFSKLSRGSFASKNLAHKWAAENLGKNATYQVKRFLVTPIGV